MGFAKTKSVLISLLILVGVAALSVAVYAASHTDTIIWGYVENNSTSTLVRVCGTGPKEQIRAENVSPGAYWISQIYSYDWAINNSCTPESPYGWRLVVNGQPGDKMRIFSLVEDNYLSEAEFMRQARRDFCTVTSLGNVSCTRISDYPLETYFDRNYANTWCYSTSAGSANVASTCNEEISSLILQSGWSVRVFRDQNQNGPSKCFTTSDSDLSNDTFDGGTAMNDAISSFTLYHQSSCPPLTSSISGQIKDRLGNPIAQVSVNTGQYSAMTDNNGNYTVQGIQAGNYTIQTSKDGYTFSPFSRNVTVPPAASGQNFTGYQDYFISGRVTTNGQAVAGVPIVVKKFGLVKVAEATTNANGIYKVDALSPGVYLIASASGSPYTLTPGNHIVPIIRSNVTDKDFTIQPIYGALGGTVTERGSGKAIANATVWVAGKKATGNASGVYNFSQLLPGQHTIKVTATGYKDYQGKVTVMANASNTHNVTLELIRSEGYRLPYPGGDWFVVTQGNGGFPSHQWGTPSQYAYDFSKYGAEGRPVVASRAGKVIDFEDRYTGSCYNAATGSCSNPCPTNFINLLHDDNTVSVHLHIQQSSVPVVKNQYVASGEIIGRVGNVGCSSGAHLHFQRENPGSWWSIQTSFLDVSTNNGIPQQGSSYTSDNYLLKSQAAIGPHSVDATPPTGSVQFHLTGQMTPTLSLYVFDYDSNTVEMRLASTKADVDTASWQAYTDTVTWPAWGAWVQFKDEAGNLSEVYSDTVEAIAFEPLQANFAVDSTVCVGTPPQIENTSTPLCLQCGWDWDLGDGHSSQALEPYLPYPYIGYTSPGLYTITLTAANINNVSSHSTQIEVLAIPSPEFTMSLSGNTLNVESKATTAANWIWDFGDGITTTGRIASHTYTSTEVIDQMPLVRLIVEGTNDCNSEAYQFIQKHEIYLPMVIKE